MRNQRWEYKTEQIVLQNKNLPVADQLTFITLSTYINESQNFIVTSNYQFLLSKHIPFKVDE